MWYVVVATAAHFSFLYICMCAHFFSPPHLSFCVCMYARLPPPLSLHRLTARLSLTFASSPAPFRLQCAPPSCLPLPPTLLRASFPAWNSTSLLLLLLPPVLCNGLLLLLLALFPLHDIDPIPKRTTHKEIETGGKHIANWRWGLGLFLSPLFFAPAIVEPIMQICVISTVQCIGKCG